MFSSAFSVFEAKDLLITEMMLFSFTVKIQIGNREGFKTILGEDLSNLTVHNSFLL